MADEVGGDHDEEESGCQREDSEEVWVEADEGADGEEGEGVCGDSPGQETDEACLEDEDDANAASSVDQARSLL